MNRVCPSPDQLQLMASGSLPDPPAGEVEEHVLNCPRCQEATASFREGDTFIADVRKAGKAGKEIMDGLAGEDRVRVERLISELSDVRLNSIGTRPRQGTAEPPFAHLMGENWLNELTQRWHPPEQPGELGRLGGYRVLELLGSGGMGAVFLALDSQLQRNVALKVMRPRAAEQPGAAERFLREARATAAVKNDHVVTIYQVGQGNGIPFIAQELLEGETLEDRLQRQTRLSVAEAVAIARQIAAGLAAAHTRGLLHRDIKPANVWLQGIADCELRIAESSEINPRSEIRNPKWKVKLLDFGLARSLTEDVQLTQTGQIVGTPAYMSPEQANGQQIDARADLFSLGVVLYRMLTGNSPFARSTLTATLSAIGHEMPPAVSTLVPQVPSPLSELVGRLLAKDPQQRPASAAEVALMLTSVECLDTECTVPNTQTPRGGPPLFAAKTRPRRRMVIVLAGLAAAAMVAGTIVIKIKYPDGTRAEVRVSGDPEITISREEDASPRAEAASAKREATAARPAVPPRAIAATQPLSSLALVTRPAVLPGVKSWTIETIPARGYQELWRGMALDPSGKWLAFCDGGCSVRFINTETRTIERTIVLPAGLRSLDWSRDGTLLAALAHDRVFVFDPASGRIVFSTEIANNHGLWDLQWSPDSQRLAIAADRVHFWDRKSGQVLSMAAEQPASSLAWSPTVPILAVGGNDSNVRLLDTATGKITHTLRGHFATWSPDGTRLATCISGGVVRFWNSHTGENIGALSEAAPRCQERGIAWSPDGKNLAYGSDWATDTILVNAETHEVVASAPGWYQTGLKQHCWSPDSKVLYRTPNLFMQANRCLDALDVTRRESATQWIGFSGSPSEGLSPDAKRMIVNFKESLKGLSLDTQGGSVHLKHWAGTPPVWSADGKALAVGHGFDGIKLLDRSFSSLGTIKPDMRRTGFIRCISLSPTARQLAIGHEKRVEIWDCFKGTLVTALAPQQGNTLQLSWSPDGRFLALWHEEGMVLWRLSSPTIPIFSQASKPVERSLQWSNEDNMLLVGGDLNLWVVDPEKGEIVRSLTGPTTVRATDYDYASQLLVMVSADGTVSHTAANELGSKPIGKTQPCFAARFLDGGRLLATNRKLDPAVFMWDSKSCEARGTVVPFANEHHLLVSPDGHHRGSPGIEVHLVYVIETESGQETLTPAEFSTRFGWKNDPTLVAW